MKETQHIQGKTDIAKAVYLLREIDAWLNQEPTKSQLKEMRKTIQDFTKHFPDCWDCCDTGCIGPLGEVECGCTKLKK